MRPPCGAHVRMCCPSASIANSLPRGEWYCFWPAAPTLTNGPDEPECSTKSAILRPVLWMLHWVNCTNSQLLTWTIYSKNLEGFLSFTQISFIISRYNAFSVLTLLVGRQEGHLTCKNWMMECWHGYLSRVRCRLAYGAADTTAAHYILLQ